MNFRKTSAVINLSALEHNFKQLKNLARVDFFCPMVKADAYGHGAIKVVEALSRQGVEHFGVALVEEGVALRLANLKRPNIYIFGVFDASGAKAVVEHRLVPVLSRRDQIEELEQVLPAHAGLAVHIKFNTGMNRLGFDIEEHESLHKYFANSKKLKLTGLCTHLAGNNDSSQISTFTSAAKTFSDINHNLHIYNSEGFLRGSFPSEGFRPGITLYGERPTASIGAALELRPVMTMKSEIVMIHHLQKGEAVSYGGRWQAARSSTIATVAIGYADGLRRSLSPGGEMLYRGRRVPIVGTICMDYTMIDLTESLDAGPPKLGEEVVVFGEQLGQYLRASEIAERLGTIPYEVFVNVSGRVPREYK